MRYELKKNLAGKYSLKFKCPKCGIKLSETLNNAGQRDVCPECGQTIVIPGEEKLTQQREEQAKIAREKQAATEQIAKIKADRKADKQELGAMLRSRKFQLSLAVVWIIGWIIFATNAQNRRMVHRIVPRSVAGTSDFIPYGDQFALLAIPLGLYAGFFFFSYLEDKSS